MCPRFVRLARSTSLARQDKKHLETLEAAISTKYCRPGCDGCYGSCPRGVPIWDILRYKMYFENYGDQKFAMERYARTPGSNSAAACTGCSAPCEAACSHGISVRARLLEVHTQLTFAAPAPEEES